MTFDDVVEQRHIVTTLKNSINNNAISHAYLFCGTRGTGKTTLAKILARAINCLNPEDGSPCNKCSNCRGILDGSIIDVIEIDAASNNGVDDVREIKEAVMYVPAVTRYKVYIIDEVHMLSTGAFNALLKTLEEPPPNVVFILATTEPHKLPATILSRCQRFDFKRISLPGLKERLKVIAEDCGISFDDQAISLIARLAQGGMRDAISLLDQCTALGKASVTREDVAAIAGLSSTVMVDRLTEAIIERDTQKAIASIKSAMDEGLDLQPLCSQLIDRFRNLMLAITGGEALKLIEADEEEMAQIRDLAQRVSLDEVLSVIKELSETEGRLKWSENQRITLEVSVIRLCSRNIDHTNASNEGLIQLESRIQQLEKRISELQSGTITKPRNAKNSEISSAAPARENPPTEVRKKDHTPASSGASGEKPLRQWPDVIEYVRSMGKMKVFAYLLDTNCVVVNGNTAAVLVPGDDGLKKTVLSRNDSLEVIADALKKTTGMELKVKITDEKSFEARNPVEETDPDLERIKQFASKNNIPLDIRD